MVVDTAGVRSYSLNGVPLATIAHGFREFLGLSSGCRFSDCSHLNEPGCAVVAAVSAGHIDPLRYISYAKIAHNVKAGTE